MSIHFPQETLASDARQARERACIDAARTALVHICVRRRGPAARRRLTPPEDLENLPQVETSRYLARVISTWLGQPERCHDAACRRAKVCERDPPDCWRDEPPTTEEEGALARIMFRQQLDAALVKLRKKEEQAMR